MVDVGGAASGSRRSRKLRSGLAIPVVTHGSWGAGSSTTPTARSWGTYLGLAGTPEVSALVEDSDALLMWA